MYCEALNEEGVTSVTGSAWHASTIRGMLTNEKYKGDSLLQKYYTPENMRNTVKNNGQVTQFYVTESHEAIIASEDWEHVQELIAYNRKQRGIKKGNPDYTNRYPIMYVSSRKRVSQLFLKKRILTPWMLRVKCF